MAHEPFIMCYLMISGVSTSEYTAVPMQGSGTFAVESVFQTTVPRTGGKVCLYFYLDADGSYQ